MHERFTVKICDTCPYTPADLEDLYDAQCGVAALAQDTKSTGHPASPTRASGTAELEKDIAARIRDFRTLGSPKS